MLPSRSSSSRYPASFATIPRELLPYIAANLDKASSLAFARVSRECTTHSEARIWRDLDLFLPERYGQRPLIQPYATDNDDPRYIAWAQAEARGAEEAHRAGLKKKLQGIMMRLDDRRAQMIRTAVVMPVLGTYPYLISLLGAISPHIQQLSVEAAPEHFYGSRHDPAWMTKAHESFDISIIGQGLAFPSLQHLHIGENAARHIEYIYLLCCAATPTIRSLYVARHDSFSLPSTSPASPQYPPFRSAISLRQIHISFRGEGNDGILYTRNAQRLLALVIFSPELRQLSMDLPAGVPSVQELLQQLSPGPQRGARLKKLEDLYWQEDAAEVHALVNGPEKPFTTVKRLVVLSDNWKDMLPNLETLFLKRDYHPFTALPPPTDSTTESTALAMIPSFAASLSYSCHLHAIHELTSFDEDASDELGIFAELDRIQHSSQYTGVIRSFRHGMAELFHARFFLFYRETADTHPPLVDFDKNLQATLPYTALDGSKRVKVFDKLDTPIYQDYTYFDGLCVPMEIIERMREVQGASEGAWWGRGIEVGEAAWAVLLEWKDQQTVEAVVDGLVKDEDEDDDSDAEAVQE